ncbi:MAG TPA: glycerophosphodiester phosphodiesterase family protein [Flavihumibacter sp.]|jgi:glycerophosphoryl diester phosphodiesterase
MKHCFSIKRFCLSALLLIGSVAAYAQPYKLIAHRGGIVDSLTPENSLPALEKAIQKGYWMVEIDLRITADSVLITQHDRNFKRYFGVDSAVTSMTWEQIQKLRTPFGTRVLLFEEVLQACQGKINVMIDNKIQGMDSALFYKVIALLDKYNLRENALMIGTDESTEFFTGKVRLSCTRKQVEENKLRSDYNPSHYYLFSSDISSDDVKWAKKEKLMVVGVLNHRAPFSPEAREKMKRTAASLLKAGVRNFQLDAAFEDLLK